MGAGMAFCAGPNITASGLCNTALVCGRNTNEITGAMNTYKEKAAARALDYVKPGMLLGLGTGSTAARFVELLAEKVSAGLMVTCVPTSEATRALAERLKIPLTTLDEQPELDITFDGADEIDPHLRLIKGGGGAHLREKIVAMASAQVIIIADASKKVETLGKFPLPIEVVQFGLKATANMIEAAIEDAGCSGSLSLRHGPDGKPFITDSGNVILDAALGKIPDPETLSDILDMIPGVVEHGLFIGIADKAIIAGPSGVDILEAPSTPTDYD